LIYNYFIAFCSAIRYQLSSRCGGAMVNEHAEVMRTDGSVIEGLYAAGNCAASLCGPHYVGAGQSIGASSVAGFIVANMSAR
jgi:3-oxosteroid 1-dehydrogenase